MLIFETDDLLLIFVSLLIMLDEWWADTFPLPINAILSGGLAGRRLPLPSNLFETETGWCDDRLAAPIMFFFRTFHKK